MLSFGLVVGCIYLVWIVVSLRVKDKVFELFVVERVFWQIVVVFKNKFVKQDVDY